MIENKDDDNCNNNDGDEDEDEDEAGCVGYYTASYSIVGLFIH